MSLEGGRLRWGGTDCFWALLTLFWADGLRWGWWGTEREAQGAWGSRVGINVSDKRCFSYLSHSSVGMSQLDHHREVRGCELKKTRGNASLLSQRISAKALGPACSVERSSHLTLLGIPTRIHRQMGILPCGSNSPNVSASGLQTEFQHF